MNLVIILKVIELIKIISIIVCDRDGYKVIFPSFSGYLNRMINRQIDFWTVSGFTRTPVLLQFTRKLQMSSDFEKWKTSLHVSLGWCRLWHSVHHIICFWSFWAQPFCCFYITLQWFRLGSFFNMTSQYIHNVYISLSLYSCHFHYV